MKNDDPLLVLIAFDSSEMLVGGIDDTMEHLILLRKCNYPEQSIDRFFRIVLNHSGADWTFVCPSDYKNITDRTRRISRYYDDGVDTITPALKLLGYDVLLNIPARYRRHLCELGGE